MDYSLCPTDGPPRLLRFVDHTHPGWCNRVATFDGTKNLLLIDRVTYNALTSLEQQIVITSQVRDLGVGGENAGSRLWVDLDRGSRIRALKP